MIVGRPKTATNHRTSYDGATDTGGERATLPKRRFHSHRDAKLAIFDYIEVFYNRRRRHTAIGNVAPATFESGHFTSQPGLAA